MRKDQQYIVIKPIPLGNNKFIPVNTDINCTHGIYYMNGVILNKDYQEDFEYLISKEEIRGWEYVVPVKQKTMFTNKKEDL